MEKSLVAKYTEVFVVVAAYWLISISMVFLNKHLLSSAEVGLNAPLFVTFYQCICSLLICISMSFLSSVNHRIFTFPALDLRISTMKAVFLSPQYLPKTYSWIRRTGPSAVDNVRLNDHIQQPVPEVRGSGLLFCGPIPNHSLQRYAHLSDSQTKHFHRSHCLLSDNNLWLLLRCRPGINRRFSIAIGGRLWSVGLTFRVSEQYIHEECAAIRW